MAHLLHDLLAESAARAPDHEAVRFREACLTYRQLEARTNQLARTLREAGVRRGERVGILVHKSTATLFSPLAAMRAGGAYVPLDANAPAGRLAYIARDCDIRTLVTSAHAPALARLLAEPTPIETVVLTDEREPSSLPAGVRCVSWSTTLEQDEGPIVPSGAIESDLAYILYTSGSTGDPKGVMISHRTSMTFVDWCAGTFGLATGDRVTSHAPLHFDLSIFDLYAALQGGATIVMVPESTSVFPIELARLLERERITVTYLVPSVLSLMGTYGALEAHDLTRIRAVLFAGEVFPIRHLRRLADAIPGAALYNLYGPTETNVCTAYRVRPEDLDPERTQPVPIGVACANTDVFAVDHRGQVIDAPGQEGELWVRGPGVAYGYWGDPERTADRFIENPFQPRYREVAYRTGDIVTLAEDGVSWIYLGRRDHMVKSRGYRIELGEIETALYRHDGVKEAAAVAIPDDLVGNRIVAFVVLMPGFDGGRQELTEHCSGLLPRYMVPERIDICEGLPKTSTGKLDRTALARS